MGTDKDIMFAGNDGGVAITALTLDMSAAGAATFNSSVRGTNSDVVIAYNPQSGRSMPQSRLIRFCRG